MRELINNEVVPSDLVTIDSVNRILTLQTSDIADSGLHDMLLCVTLDNFDVEYCQAFAALVSDCEVTDLELVPVDPPGTMITYEITENAELLVVPKPIASYIPSECVYDLQYTVSLFDKDNEPLPDFITFNPDTGFEI